MGVVKTKRGQSQRDCVFQPRVSPTLGKKVNLLRNQSRGDGVDPGFGNPGLKYGIPSGFTSFLGTQGAITPEVDANFQNYPVRANPDSSTT